MGLYRSLTAISGDGVGSYEGPALCGYKCGNRQQAGCLTGDQNVRLHSCERGTECSGIKSENVVWITPVITRTSTGADVPELGAGGGGGDLDHVNELELNDTAAVGRLINLCSTKIREPHRLAKIVSILSTAMVSDAKTLCFDGRFTAEDDEGNISLLSLTEILSRIAENKDTVPKLINPSRAHGEESQKSPLPTAQQLSRSIVSEATSHSDKVYSQSCQRFPYSRHSSYDELCHLVEVLKPKDVYPCTTDFDGWHEDISVKTLFGHLCSGSDFIHDREMIELKDERVASSKRKRKREEISSQDNHQGSSPRNGPESDPEVTLVGTEYAASNHDIPTSLKGKTQGPVTEKLSQGYINDPSTRTHPSRSAPHSHRDQLSVIQKTFENSSTTEEVKSPALQSTVELSSSKTYCCAWLGCPETFSTIGVLRRHVLSKHLIRVTIKGKDAYGCLWHDCPDPKILYFTSEEMWEAHMDEIHYHAEVQRALDHAGDVETGDAKTDSQNSLPTPPGANQDYENPPLLPESARSTTSTQAAPIELSDRASMLDHETDEESSDDIAIDEIADRKLRKQVSTMARGLDSSLIMARTILLAKGYQPLRELYIDQIDSADHRTKYEPAAYEKGYEEFASKVDRLREILPTADELDCLDALRKHNGSFRKARDEVAMSEQRRMATETDPGDETEVSDDQHVANDDAVDVDDEQAASQFSISSSAFNTQDSTLSPTALTSRIEDRKKAYKAARGLDGYEWAVHSPISAGNSHTEKEVEL